MKIPRAVIYPIKDGNSKDSNFELMMSLRSIDKNLQEDVPVFVLSESKPDILSDRVQFIEVDGYVDALKKAIDIADEILWMNDDIFLLRPHTWDSFRRWVLHGGSRGERRIQGMINSRNGWVRRKGRVLLKLREHGKTSQDFSSHTPYLYETSKLEYIISEFDYGYKTAFETAYGNYWKVDVRHCKKLQRYHTAMLPVDMSSYEIMNYNDKGSTPHIRGFLMGKFPEPSVYEYHGGHDLSKYLASTVI